MKSQHKVSKTQLLIFLQNYEDNIKNNVEALYKVCDKLDNVEKVISRVEKLEATVDRLDKKRFFCEIAQDG